MSAGLRKWLLKTFVVLPLARRIDQQAADTSGCCRSHMSFVGRRSSQMRHRRARTKRRILPTMKFPPPTGVPRDTYGIAKSQPKQPHLAIP